MKNNFIPLAKPFIDKDDILGVTKVLRSGLLSLGPNISEFEKKFASYIGTKYACAVSSGTAGLHLAVKALGLKNGDEVITTPFSFIASSNCLLYEGVKPVFVDIEENTFNIDPDKIEAAITMKTKALLVVHIFGQPAEMDRIMKIAKRHNLLVIEDACESVGAKYMTKSTGTFGNIGVFAFYPNKQMTTGEGGMVVTASQRIYNTCVKSRNQGRGKNMHTISHEIMGYNYRMDGMSAALGISQLNKVDKFIRERRKISKWYTDSLTNIAGIVIPKTLVDRSHSWFVYVIRVTDGNRDSLQKKLIKMGIQAKVYLPTIHLQPFMKREFGYTPGDFPVAEKVSSQALALPLFVGLKKKEVIRITNIIKLNV